MSVPLQGDVSAGGKGRNGAANLPSPPLPVSGAERLRKRGFMPEKRVRANAKQLANGTFQVDVTVEYVDETEVDHKMVNTELVAAIADLKKKLVADGNKVAG